MKQPSILFEDKYILVCYKPAGMPVQTKSVGGMDLENFLKNHIAWHSPALLKSVIFKISWGIYLSASRIIFI